MPLSTNFRLQQPSFRELCPQRVGYIQTQELAVHGAEQRRPWSSPNRPRTRSARQRLLHKIPQVLHARGRMKGYDGYQEEEPGCVSGAHLLEDLLERAKIGMERASFRGTIASFHQLRERPGRDERNMAPYRQDRGDLALSDNARLGCATMRQKIIRKSAALLFKASTFAASASRLRKST